MNSETTTTSAPPKKKPLIVSIASGSSLLLLVGGILFAFKGLVALDSRKDSASVSELIVIGLMILSGLVAIFTGWNNRRVLNPQHSDQRPQARFYVTNILLLVWSAAGMAGAIFGAGLGHSADDIFASISALLALFLPIIAPGLLSLIAARKLYAASSGTEGQP